MYGSKSSATIRIIVDNEELFTTNEIDASTTEAIPFSINFGDADSIIVEAEATLRGSDFVYGMVSE